MIPRPGCCHDCTQHGQAAPKNIGAEYDGYRACKHWAHRNFSGLATSHGSTLYTHPDAGCQDFVQRTRTPRPPRSGEASPSPHKRD
ncbi:hypothetical protein [Deinococcus radiotolerans]|uniref:Uncharacterized protein n=1 Tax=Deinococcus radiotolerans TaxID=1309407 RepID=A0ABQ2FQF7_9DEIO|nr:hypothetical protein [Deinococcus radiotolerans]GGL16558.1 hypothetical protein GCM10010844_39310 [Deinococcus radiotolerans]